MSPPDGARGSERWIVIFLLVVAWALRSAPFFRSTGPLGWPVDYDEGVYLSAAHLLLRGAWPWRDFVFVHPPGILFFLAPFSALDPRSALAAARWAMTVVGTVNVALVFLSVRARGGFFGALIAAALYAAWPEAASAERRVLMEPLLNLVCLGVVWSLGGRSSVASESPDSTGPNGGEARFWLTGLALGLALSVKSWGVLWLLGAVAAAPSWRVASRWVLVAAAVLVLVTGWLIFPRMSTAWEMLVQLQLARPPDGELSRFLRLREMFYARNAVPLIALILTSPWLFKQWRDPQVRVLCVTLVLLVAAFLMSAAWWNQYDAHLAVAVAPLVGLGVGFATRTWRVPRAGAVVLAGLAISPSVADFWGSRDATDPEQAARAEAIAQLAPLNATICAFEVSEVLLANRWPSPPVDSYGQGLGEATRDGSRYPSAWEAFASESSQRTLRKLLGTCDVVVRGWRGNAQMNATTQGLLEAEFQPVGTEIYLRRAFPIPR